MKKVLHIILISLFSLTIISCAKKSSTSSSSTTTDNTTTTTDTTAPVISEVTVFVAVGLSGNIVRSTDNGSSWDNVTSPTGNHLWEVGFSE